MCVAVVSNSQFCGSLSNVRLKSGPMKQWSCCSRGYVHRQSYKSYRKACLQGVFSSQLLPDKAYESVQWNMTHKPRVCVKTASTCNSSYEAEKIVKSSFLCPSGDNTFSDVFRDFSNMASKEPDRLQRKFDSKDPNRQTPV